MFRDIAIMPGALVEERYATRELYDARIDVLRMGLTDGTIVRNLHNGDWLRHIRSLTGVGLRGQRLLATLESRKCLEDTDNFAAACPATDAEWLAEARGSHRRMPLTGVVAPSGEAIAVDPSVAPVELLVDQPWWTSVATQRAIHRTRDGYLHELGPLLVGQPWMAFVDQYIDPEANRFEHMPVLFAHAMPKRLSRLVELHRTPTRSRRGIREELPIAEWQTSFERHWGKRVRRAGYTLRVHLWDYLHDRFLHTRRGTVAFTNSFDLDSGGAPEMTMSVVPRERSDSLLRALDPAVSAANYVGGFELR